ncbi:isopentenyl-diphosphate Delta-isomerase [Rhodoligotrophos ferricapiens]|uniref:isopentenyl-diphosphate Delta-isomerase n=1 Tax=Rhodoligotrophos ferricapiens TaxID=3069264 RepID=UPI00315CD881
MLMTTDAREALILIDERNRRVGTAEKYPAHHQGLLHRAFSIFLFDDQGRTLLQRRAAGKYHSAGKWANSCCGHPRPGESTRQAASRRISEELNITVDLTFGFHSRYRAELDRGMIENEFVYVYAGRVPEGEISPNRAEADRIMLVSLDELSDQVAQSDQRYAFWLRHYLRQHRAELDRMAAEMVKLSAGSVPPRQLPDQVPARNLS